MQAAPAAFHAQPIPSQPLAPQPPPPITPKSSGAVKIVLWVGGILLLLFVIGVGGTMYGYYWVKHKVSSYASAITNGTTEKLKVVSSGTSCRLLSTSDLQQVLGVPIEKSAEIEEGNDPGCAYYTNAEAIGKLRAAALAHARKQAAEAAKKPGTNGDNPLALLKETNQMEGIMKTLTGDDATNDGHVFTFTIARGFGSDSWSGMRLVEAAVPGFEDVSGVGDKAMIGAFGHAFYVLKGDTMVRMDTALVPDARMRGSAIGKKILGNLQ